jgi:hypothetical protein
MATPPSSSPGAAVGLDHSLDRWQRAGLIDADQGRRIRDFEASQPAPILDRSAAARLPGPGAIARPSATELLAYLGVLIALAGVVTLVYASGATLWLIAALTMAVGLVALAAAREFRGRGGAAAGRAAGACVALGTAALGVAAGEFSSAASLFTTTMVTVVDCGSPSGCPSFTSTDQSGNVLLGAAVVVGLALALLRFVPARMAAVVAAAAAYTGAVAAIDVGQFHADRSPGAIALVMLATSAVLVAAAETVRTRQSDVTGLLGFIGIVGATIPLYLVGGRSDVHLDVVAGVIAVVALAAGIVLPRAGVAYGAVIGLAGLVLDIGARNFTTPTALGVFFSVSGVAAVAALIATTRLLRRRRIGRPVAVSESGAEH